MRIKRGSERKAMAVLEDDFVNIDSPSGDHLGRK